jgi:hypothetical protein
VEEAPLDKASAVLYRPNAPIVVQAGKRLFFRIYG